MLPPWPALAGADAARAHADTEFIGASAPGRESPADGSGAGMPILARG
ncbi:MAG: hypothetical protein AB7K52_01405 [Phycisphaerales bacterium]